MKVAILAGAAGLIGLGTSLAAQQVSPAASKAEPIQPGTAPGASDTQTGTNAGSASSDSAPDAAATATKSSAHDPLAPAPQNDQPTKPKKSAKKKK